MTTSPRFLPEAEAELLHEVSYYSEARPGAGVRFQAAIEAASVEPVVTPKVELPRRMEPDLSWSRDFRSASSIESQGSNCLSKLSRPTGGGRSTGASA